MVPATYNRRMWRPSAVLVAGSLGACFGGPSPRETTLSNELPVRVARMTMFELGTASFGPITAMTPATVEAIQRAVGSAARIETVERRGPELHAFVGDELVFYVIPNDDDETLFNIHAVSPKVSIVEHPDWIIGSPFPGADLLTSCECWGDHPMCFVRGDHVAVGFVVACDGLDTPRERRVLQGVPIQRAVWNPKPFGADGEVTPPPAITSQPPKSLKEIFGGDP